MKETILSLEQAAMERWRNGDPWGWAELSAEEITYVDPGLTRPIVGLEAYKAIGHKLSKTDTCQVWRARCFAS